MPKNTLRMETKSTISEYESNQKNTSAMCQVTEKKKFNNKNFLKPQGTITNTLYLYKVSVEEKKIVTQFVRSCFLVPLLRGVKCEE